MSENDGIVSTGQKLAYISTSIRACKENGYHEHADSLKQDFLQLSQQMTAKLAEAKTNNSNSSGTNFH